MLIWAITPPRKMATWSAMDSASSWSWVTRMEVAPGQPQHVVDIGAHRGPQRGIEGGEGLVEEDDLGIGGQGAGQGDALLLPAGELVGVAAGQAGQADQFQQLVHPACRGAPRGPARRPRCARR